MVVGEEKKIVKYRHYYYDVTGCTDKTCKCCPQKGADIENGYPTCGMIGKWLLADTKTKDDFKRFLICRKNEIKER